MVEAIAGPPPVGGLQVVQVLRCAGSTLVEFSYGGERPEEPFFVLALTDDRHTAYAPRGSESWRARPRLVGWVRFVQAIPADARTLRARIGDDVVELALC